jgi:dTDP-glucose pyrophosphorylase
MSNLQVVIMAAGLGSRYGGLKQIDEFGPSQEYLMDYAIYDAHRAGISQVCVIVRDHFKAEIQQIMTKKWAAYKDLNFNFVSQETTDLPAEFRGKIQREKPWGTAHILYVLRDIIKSPFIIMNADDFYGREAIQSLNDFLRQKPNGHALVSYMLRKTLSLHGAVTRGLCDIKNDKLVSIDEVGGIEPNDTREAFASMNLWGFSPSAFKNVEELFVRFLRQNAESPKAEYQIPTMVNDLLKENKIDITAIPTKSDWFGVTYKEDKDLVKNKIAQLVERGVYPKNLFAR